MTNRFSIWVLYSVLVLGVTACVSKGKYLTALESSELATSRLTLLEEDLRAKTLATEEQQRVIAGLSKSLQELKEDEQQRTSASMSDQQAWTAGLREAKAALASAEAGKSAAEGELHKISALVRDRQLRFQAIRARLGEAVVGVPVGQTVLSQEKGFVLLTISEAVLFGGSRPALSAYGDALLSKIASALGGQTDLAIRVVAFPTAQEARKGDSALTAAARRSAKVAENLVVGHGLSPKLVSACAREDELIIVDGAPAESRLANKIVIEVGIQDGFFQRLGEVAQD